MKTVRTASRACAIATAALLIAVTIDAIYTIIDQPWFGSSNLLLAGSGLAFAAIVSSLLLLFWADALDHVDDVIVQGERGEALLRELRQMVSGVKTAVDALRVHLLGPSGAHRKVVPMRQRPPQ